MGLDCVLLALLGRAGRVLCSHEVPCVSPQPCHYTTALLIACIYTRQQNSWLFPAYLYCCSQGWFAFFTGPDPGWYIWEIEFHLFWLQHILMAVVPWIYLVTGKFDARHSRPNAVAWRHCEFFGVYAFSIAYHSAVLIATSYYGKEDFDGMLCPPEPRVIVEGVGKWWREFQGVVSILLSFAVAYVPETLCLWLRQPVQQAQNKIK